MDPALPDIPKGGVSRDLHLTGRVMAFEGRSALHANTVLELFTVFDHGGTPPATTRQSQQNQHNRKKPHQPLQKVSVTSDH